MAEMVFYISYTSSWALSRTIAGIIKVVPVLGGHPPNGQDETVVPGIARNDADRTVAVYAAPQA